MSVAAGQPHTVDRARQAQAADAGPTPEEIQVPVMENLDRAITGLITAAPPLLLGVAGWQLWNRELRLRDVVIFVVMYIPIGLGVTVGFHRLLTHRSFKTSAALRGLLAILGTMAIEGRPIAPRSAADAITSGSAPNSCTDTGCSSGWMRSSSVQVRSLP